MRIKSFLLSGIRPLETELIERGSIYWVNLDPTEGPEIGKIRPAVVISNNINNQLSDTVTIIPITSSTGKIYPFEVFIPQGIVSNDSKAKANQIRTIDKKRIKGLIARIPDGIMGDIEKALKIHLDFE